MKKKTSVHVFRESTRERHKNGTALRVVSFSRERETTREKEDEKSHIVFTSSFQKFKRERRTSPKPRHHHHHHRNTNARSKQRERKKEHACNTIPGDGVKFHKLLASPTFGPCSAIICVTSSFYEENFEHNAREAKRERFEGGI